MAPNLLRVGTTENIFVECQDCTGGDIQVDIRVVAHPAKDRTLAMTIVTLSRMNNFQALGKLMVYEMLFCCTDVSDRNTCRQPVSHY